MSGNQMVPQAIEPWRIAATVEATADGIVDALILSVYEVRYRPEDKRHQPWVDKQLRKADRGLATLEQQILELPEGLTTGHFAVAALLGWATMRFPGKIEANGRSWRPGCSASSSSSRPMRSQAVHAGRLTQIGPAARISARCRPGSNARRSPTRYWYCRDRRSRCRNPSSDIRGATSHPR